jgi:SAM-dependent methyltransferase
LSYVVPPEKLFSTYLYTSSTAKSFREHFERAADIYIDEFGLNSESCVVDIGCNDGIALVPFKNKGIKTIGVDPAENIVKLCRNKGIETIQGYFDSNAVDAILDKHGKVDLITASNVFAHSDDIKFITTNVFKLLKDTGTFIIEVQYLKDTLSDLTFDNIYHEHLSYWSVTSLNNFFNSLGYTITKVEHIQTHGGSIRVYVNKNSIKIDASVEKFLQEEKKFGLTNFETYKDFFDKIENIKEKTKKAFTVFKNKNKKIIGYGAPAKATTTLNYYKIDKNYIEYVVEDNILKHKKYIPGVNIPIFSKEELKNNKPDIIIVMAWNFIEEIRKNNKNLIDEGIQIFSIKEIINLD